ncbi:uncharacterized protein LOC126840852 isoform X2 [Adelges cooleyi]|uniref:uncharacterized protein LOC126840852 isoform X2 n=1 Tax=Adelges cooleyi TaxID=133065 RepID=UPI00217F4F34|nr:uncharacterized protein LOC126840852 isoform X2 [Adelges cooleyi]
MISHFTAILLCLSGVYCISSAVDNLDFDGLQQILSGKTVIAEWNTVMAQHIYKEEAMDSKNTVRQVVEDFMRNPNNNAETDLSSIRNIIKTGYQCAFTKYASITTWLILKDLWQFKLNIDRAIIHAESRYPDINVQRIFEDERFPEIILRTFGRSRYNLDYDFKFKRGDYQLLTKHKSVRQDKDEVHKLWAGIIDKKLGLKIKHKIYTEVIKTKLTNEYAQPLVDTINELICVLNEAIQMFDNFNVDKCGKHDGKFVNIFKSLTTGVEGDFKFVLWDIDEMVGRGEIPGLVRDLTKSTPETLPGIDTIKASGCFVDSLEFELSGLKMDFANTNGSKDIYGPSLDERESEIKMKLVENIGKKTIFDDKTSSRESQSWCSIN